MLIPGLCISWTFHERLLWNIVFSNAVDNDMDVNVAGTIMTVWVRANNGLMTRKIFYSKFFSEFLCTIRCEAVFIFVTRIKTDDVVVCFDFFSVSIFLEMGIGFLALFRKRSRCAVDGINKIRISWNASSVFIQNRLSGKFIMLGSQIIISSSVVGILNCNVFNDCHDIHQPFLLDCLSSHRDL